MGVLLGMPNSTSPPHHKSPRARESFLHQPLFWPVFGFIFDLTWFILQTDTIHAVDRDEAITLEEKNIIAQLERIGTSLVSGDMLDTLMNMHLSAAGEKSIVSAGSITGIEIIGDFIYSPIFFTTKLYSPEGTLNFNKPFSLPSNFDSELLVSYSVF